MNNRKQLQATVKAYRANGHTTPKLNTTTVALQSYKDTTERLELAVLPLFILGAIILAIAYTVAFLAKYTYIVCREIITATNEILSDIPGYKAHIDNVFNLTLGSDIRHTPANIVRV